MANIDPTVLVAAITSIGALLVSLANNALGRKAKKPIEGTYAAVNSGRMERLEGAVFDLCKQVAALDGKIDSIGAQPPTSSETDSENEDSPDARN